MCAQSSRTGEPYKLAGSRLIFTDWYYVRPAGFGWFDADGTCVNVTGDLGPTDAQMRHVHRPWGIRLRAYPAERTAPLLTPAHPWESGTECITTLLHDRGRYRAWGTVGHWGDLKGRGPDYFCYFESADGLHWERPDCGILPYARNPHTNLLGEVGGTVFYDPSAPAYERYKWIAERRFSQEVFAAYQAARPDAVDPRSARADLKEFVGVQGAVSVDGLHWELLPQPLVMAHSDTQIVAYFDPLLKQYVGYFRDWQAGPQAERAQDASGLRWRGMARRAIGRAATSDFHAFPLPETILEPGPAMDPSESFYTNCRTTLPGAPDQHLLFPAIWSTVTDRTRLALYASHDGAHWQAVPGGDCLLDTAPFGEWDGGCVFGVPNLEELPTGDFVLPYTGYNVPHKYPRVQATRNTAYARWPKGRLVALEAPERGEFATVAVVPPGSRLTVNAVVGRAGHLLIEAFSLNQRPIRGREFANALPLTGDLHWAPVTWKNADDLGIEKGEAVGLRIKMEDAKLFGLGFG